MRRATLAGGNLQRLIHISIHALRAEGDRIYLEPFFGKVAISIHALRAEGDLVKPFFIIFTVNFNPRPPCGGRPSNYDLGFIMIAIISIHALRAEGDTVKPKIPANSWIISIHALRAEGD